MRILLSNDDGILAPGLAAMYAALKGLGEVQVVAPANPQSGAGQSITVLHPLSAQRVHVKGEAEFAGFSVDGSPADCVRLAVRKLLDRPPDLVISGINHGANVGTHVFYSGTVAAAAEGTLSGIPSVAFSADIAGGELDFPRIAQLCRWVLDRLLANGLEASDLLNVNIPSLANGIPRGVRPTVQSTAEIVDTYLEHTDAQGLKSYTLGGYHFLQGPADNDVDALAEGFITITPLHVDRTARERIDGLSNLNWGPPPA